MNQIEIIEKLRQYGVVPVIAIDSVEAAIPLADALIDGGLPVAEITFRTNEAAEVIDLLRKERPHLTLGAGTVITHENLEAAAKCGAQFAVAPGLNPGIVSQSADMSIPFIPGVATPSEIEKALTLGCKTLKFFPSEASGGVLMLKALFAPYAHTGVRFVPTGGIKPENLEQYILEPAVAAVGGTWIATKEDINKGDWDSISEKCRAACRIVKTVRR